MEKVKMALAQLVCEDGQIESNLKRVDQILDEFGHSHDLILFPETYTMGFPAREICRSLAQPLNGPVVKYLEQKAREVNTTIVTGLYERDGEQVYNTSILVDPDGLILSYRKTHLWVGESAKVEAGNKYRSCSWQDTKLGLLICYDIEFPETARIVASLGAEILLVTDGNMHPYGPVHRTAIQARAQENQIFVAMANRVGKDKDSNTYIGGSMIADPYGQVLVEASNNKEEVLTATLDLSMVSKSRQLYHYLNERRLDNVSDKIQERPNGIVEIEI